MVPLHGEIAVFLPLAVGAATTFCTIVIHVLAAIIRLVRYKDWEHDRDVVNGPIPTYPTLGWRFDIVDSGRRAVTCQKVRTALH